MTKHIDDWLDEPPTSPLYMLPDEKRARLILEVMRMPAWKIDLYQDFLKTNLLFCTYIGVRYRVNFASRLGDLGLHNDHTKSYGYSISVDVMECSQWSDSPIYIGK